MIGDDFLDSFDQIVVGNLSLLRRCNRFFLKGDAIVDATAKTTTRMKTSEFGFATRHCFVVTNLLRQKNNHREKQLVSVIQFSINVALGGVRKTLLF